jgi:CRISPR-associated protein Csb2
MLTVAWQYLTGRCVATDFADRARAEWPPHPDRVFQALVAAWGGRGADEAERKALEWLEQQGNPRLLAPVVEDEPAPVKVYVPVNDIQTKQPKKYPPDMLALLPSHRSRKDRCFPHVRVGDGTCALIWDVDIPAATAKALECICADVARIGHSSSLVRCWVATDAGPLLAQPDCTLYQPQRQGAMPREYSLRVAEPGRLEQLVSHHRAITAGRIGDILPPQAREYGYQRVGAHRDACQGTFASPVWVFRQSGGSRLSLHQTLDVTQALRHALMAKSNTDPALLQFISGHAADGAPLKDLPHLACMPLAFVGHRHADGHIVGVALALPKAMDPAMEDALCNAIGQLVEGECERTGDPNGECLRLVLGAKGDMCLAPENRATRPWNLRSETWCRPSRTWGSVTPIVMDRMQNARRRDPARWAAEQIADMCARQGIPRPTQVLVRSVSFLSESPTAHEFPPLRHKNGAHRRMVHALLTFPQPVTGPLLLGSGRFKGYGICRPTTEPAPTNASADALSLVNAEPPPASTNDSESATPNGRALP